jgi:prophage regulatory protein
MQSKQPQRYFSDSDLAQTLGVSRNTIWRWAREGRLSPPIKIGPNCTRWPESAIEALVRRHAA